MNKKRAFTLAEILVTVALVGVLAALTVPSVILRFEKRQNYIAFKNTHAYLNQMLKYARTSNGSVKNWDFLTNKTNTQGFNAFFLPYLDVNRDCNLGAGCFATNYSTLKGDPYTVPAASRKVVLANGAALGYSQNFACITTTGNPNGTRTNNPTACATFLVDINGPEKPNQLGKDLFEFKLYQFYDIINPTGTFKDNYDSTNRAWTRVDTSDRLLNCSTDGEGLFCGARIIEDGGIKY